MRPDKVLIAVSVASMIDQFNLPNIQLMQEMGFQVHVACNFSKGNTCDHKRIQAFQELLQEMHVVWYQWDCPRNVYAVQKCWKACRQLLHLMEKNHYTWMHCHSPIGGALARVAAHIKGVPVIYTAHGFHFYQGAPLKNWLLYYPVEALLAHWTNVLLTVNKEDYCFAKKHLKAEKICYIPGIGIDIERFQEPLADRAGKEAFHKKYRIPQDAAVLLSVGELSKRKNHQMVIAALPAIQKKKKVYYVICGQGAQKKALLRQADQLGIAKYVRMLGYQDQVEELYQNADLFVFPSLQEGMPAALMEAMAAGLPCVVSDIRGNRELIDPCGGRKFSLVKKTQLVEGIIELLNHEPLRKACGSYNAKKVSGYDKAGVINRTKSIYQGMEKTVYGAENKQRKVLHVLKSSHFSGAENVALTICRNCKEEVQTAYASGKGEIQNWLEAEHILYYPMKKLNLKELSRVLAANQPDIVHAHDFTAAVLCAMKKNKYHMFFPFCIVKKQNFHLISHLHNNPPWIRRWTIKSVCYQMARRTIDHILVVSNAVKDEAVFLKHVKTGITVIGNPVDAVRVQKLSEQKTVDAFDLVFAGRLERQKDPKQFIRIVYQICRRGRPVHAAILGDGELAKDCQMLISKLHMQPYIKMKGFLANPYPYMRQAKLLMIPSEWEGFGLVAVEALVLGTPVLASPVGGLKDIFRHFPQALCRNEEEFAAKAAKLVNDSSLYERFRTEQLQKVKVQHLDVYMRRMQTIYRGWDL